jgi:hypothetical protein
MVWSALIAMTIAMSLCHGAWRLGKVDRGYRDHRPGGFVKRVLTWGGVALLLLTAACGGGDKNESKSEGTPAALAGSTGAQASPTAAAGAVPSYPGEPPATPDTARLDRILSAVQLPRNADVAGRKDIGNEAPDYKDVPDVVRRFREYGRQTGAFYIINVAGQPRLSLAISQYATPDGAKKELEFGRGSPNPDDRIDASGIGEDQAAFRVRLGGQGGPTPAVVSFTRGRYYVVVTDTAAQFDAPPDMVVAIARAVDEQLKANPAQ